MSNSENDQRSLASDGQSVKSLPLNELAGIGTDARMIRAEPGQEQGNDYNELSLKERLCKRGYFARLVIEEAQRARSVGDIVQFRAINCSEPGERYLLTLSSNGLVRSAKILPNGDLSGFRVIRNGQEGVKSLTFDRSGEWLVIFDGDSFEVTQLGGGVSNRMEWRLGGVSCLSLDWSAKSLLIGGSDGRIYRWIIGQELESELADSYLERYVGSPSVISAIASHPTSRLFFSGNWNGDLSAWLVFSEKQFDPAEEFKLFIGRFNSEPSLKVKGERNDNQIIDHLLTDDAGQNLFIATQAGVLEQWLIRGFDRVGSVQAHKGMIYSLSVAPDSRRIATAGRDGKLRVWSSTLAPTKPWEQKHYDLVQLREFEKADITAILFASEARVYVADKNGLVDKVDI